MTKKKKKKNETFARDSLSNKKIFTGSSDGGEREMRRRERSRKDSRGPLASRTRACKRALSFAAVVGVRKSTYSPVYTPRDELMTRHSRGGMRPKR